MEEQEVFEIIIKKDFEKRKYKNSICRIAYTYLHGELEDIAKHDIYAFYKPSFFKNEYYYNDLKEGIYKCTYNNLPCLFYYWKSVISNPCGLVILEKDKKSILYAEKCFKQKKEVI